jgi:hypothetical protein
MFLVDCHTKEISYCYCEPSSRYAAGAVHAVRISISEAKTQAVTPVPLAVTFREPYIDTVLLYGFAVL